MLTAARSTPDKDLYRSKSITILSGNGADASTAFPDTGATPRTWAAGGNAKLSTAQQKFGTASFAFAADSFIYPTTGTAADFAFGAGDFTVEYWVYFNVVNADQFLHDGRPATTNGWYPGVYLNSSATLIYFANNAARITGTTSVSATTWHHIALCRSGTSTKLFLNGTQEGSTFSDSNTYLNTSSQRPILGASGYNTTGFRLNGYLDELRITKGVARYPAAFTAPTAPFPTRG